jgi:hypothetical protein
MIKLVNLLTEARDSVWIVYLRQSPRMHWQLNLVERDKNRAINLAKEWKQEMVEYGQKNGKKWDVQAAIDPVEDFTGAVADYDNLKQLSSNAKLV